MKNFLVRLLFTYYNLTKKNTQNNVSIVELEVANLKKKIAGKQLQSALISQWQFDSSNNINLIEAIDLSPDPLR